jgi:uncharacterized membrane protein
VRIDLVAHIVAGGLGIILGFVALSVVKGGALHRKSGMMFVYAMVTMALLGAMMAATRRVAPGANVPIGLLTAYLVITGLTTVRPATAASRRVDVGLMTLALALAISLFTFAFEAFSSPKGKLYGMPPLPFVIFGSIGLLAALGDVRLIRSGGVQVIRGAPRLVRHLWRMCVALLIAAFSFFLGQAKVIPKPIRIIPLLMIPPLIVLGALLYWLWRIRIRRAMRGIVVVRAAEAA